MSAKTNIRSIKKGIKICKDKRQFNSFQDANEFRIFLQQKYETHQFVYECDYCACWHLTSQPNDNLKRMKLINHYKLIGYTYTSLIDLVEWRDE